MATIHIICGLPKSGKSTFARRQSEWANSCGIPSVHLTMEDVSSKRTPQEARSAFAQRCVEALKKGFDVYAEAAHIYPGTRRTLIKAVEPYVSTVEFEVLNVPASVCVLRNEDTDSVPNWLIRKMWREFVFPHPKESSANCRVAIHCQPSEKPRTSS